MIVIVDYGMGNLHSAQKGFERAGHRSVIADDPEALSSASGVVLPGVGAFKDCYDSLFSRGFRQSLLDAVNAGKPLLGICVGMQLLFDESEEGEGSQGLGLLSGKVVRFKDASETGLKVPHMGWNRLLAKDGRPCPLLDGLQSDPYVYFVHSYFPIPSGDCLVYASADYGGEFAAIVGQNNVFATQFHPEKSQLEGIRILNNFGCYVQRHANSSTLTSSGESQRAGGSLD